MVRRLFTLVVLCVLGACGGDSSPTGGGGDPSGNGGDNPGNGSGNGGDNSGGDRVENTEPIFDESRSTLQVLSVETPDTLLSGSQPVMFSVTVQDSDQFVDPIEVVMRLSRGDSVWTLPQQESIDANTALFGAMFDSTLAVGLAGDQTLQFQAVDADAGGSMMLTKEIYLENGPPILSDPETPARMERRTGDLLNVRLAVSDPQGGADIDSVYFKFRKPDGSFGGATVKDGGFHFLLVDNGSEEYGDAEKGDGRFAWAFKIPPEDAQLGSYTFLFFARDKAGNLGNILTTDFELVPLER
jgi:hypothetical protein